MSDHLDVYRYLKEESYGEEPAISSHLKSCDECHSRIDETRPLLALLNRLPDINPTPLVWQRIEARVSREGRPSVHAFRWWLRLAAAASILFTMVGIFFLLRGPEPRMAATIASVSPGSPHRVGARIEVGETFHTPAFATLSLPDVGVLKVNRDSSLRFETPRRVRLLQGEVFAEIAPSGRGFEIRCDRTTVTVHGTRFGVRYGEAVYVVEGRVRVKGPEGRILLASGGVGDLTPLLRKGARLDSMLAWLRAAESPTLSLALRPRTGNAVPPRSWMEWDLVFTSDASLLLDDPLSPDQIFLLRIENQDGRAHVVPIDRSMLTRKSPPSAKVVLDPGRSEVVTCRIPSHLFESAGTFRVTAVYLGRGAWSGLVESRPLSIEVRK